MSWSSAATLMWSAVSGAISRSSRRATRCAMWNAPSAWPNRECSAPGYTSHAKPICLMRRRRCITWVSSSSAIGRSAALNSMSPCTGSRNTRSLTAETPGTGCIVVNRDGCVAFVAIKDYAQLTTNLRAGGGRGAKMSLVSQVRDVWIERLDGDARGAQRDRVVVEAPLQLRARGTPVATVMRTPGHDLELVRGLLHAESVVAGALTQIDEDSVEIDCAASAFAGRGLLGSVTRGVCARVAIADLELRAREVTADTAMAHGVIAGLPAALRAAQSVFDT